MNDSVLLSKKIYSSDATQDEFMNVWAALRRLSSFYYVQSESDCEDVTDKQQSQ